MDRVALVKSSSVFFFASVRERIGAQLEMHDLAGGSFAAFHVKRRPGGIGRPRPLPFQPAFGSSMRPSMPLAKKPIG